MNYQIYGQHSFETNCGVYVKFPKNINRIPV